ncbi:MAG TPA: sugar ABC transporter substrate-binding protein [Conexibacter sp.]
MTGRDHVAKGAVVAAIAALALTVGACGSNDSPGSSTGGSTTSDAGGKRLTVGYSSKGSDQFQLVMQEQAIGQLEAAGLEALEPTSSQGDPGQQITDVRNLVSAGANAILVAPGDSAAIKPAVDFLNGKQIPVVALDSSPSTSRVAMVVRTDNVGAGAAGCELIGRALGGRGTALALQGDYNSESGLDRGNGFLDCMREKFPDIAVIDRHMDWKTDRCAQLANTELKAHDEIGAIYMASETICMAPVLAALKGAGRDAPQGEDGHVFTVGIDGSPFALKMVREGKLDADLSQPLDLYAKYGVDYLRRAADGETFRAGPTDHDTTVVESGPNLVDLLPVTVVTKDNASSDTLWGNAVEQ